jgi:23S rRNA (uracil1939-C5)-methyltransferase
MNYREIEYFCSHSIRVNMQGSNKLKPKDILENIEITAATGEGKGFGKYNELAVFVDHAVPGDIVDVEIKFSKKNFAEGIIKSINKASAHRIMPVCQHFTHCGGCKWQQMDYSEQLKYKHQQVEDQLIRIGKLDIPSVMPIIGGTETYFYRNKLDFSFSNKRWYTAEDLINQTDYPFKDALGFHVPRLFDKVIDIEKCYLQSDPSNAIRNFIRNYAHQNELSFYDIKNRGGFFRNLIIRNTSIGEWMVLLSFYDDNSEAIKAVCEALKETFPMITALLYVVNQKGNDTVHDLEIQTFHGKDHIVEEMEGLRFKIGPKSFYQTNSQQAYELYKVARNFAGLKGDELVYDLYTGTGTIAQFIAKQAKQVIGIEYVEAAIADAKINAKLNQIDNVQFFAGDMKKVLNAGFIQTHGQPEVIITDPPRAGMDVPVIEAIKYCRPKKIVYVSCNPATQARDLQLLSDTYKVTKIQPVDMFPQTAHVENVVLCELI